MLRYTKIAKGENQMREIQFHTTTCAVQVEKEKNQWLCNAFTHTWEAPL